MGDEQTPAWHCMQTFLGTYDWLTGGRPVPSPLIASVSGGADSVALARLLPGEPGWQTQFVMKDGSTTTCEPSLIIVHINHQLRGAESDADAAFVEEVAASLGVKCIVEQAPVAHLPGNLEDNARKARYEILERIAEQHGSEYICTGHTLDDQVETVLHRIIRGTSLEGLRGIHESRRLKNCRIIRPLIRVTRSQIVDYLASIGQTYRTDSSNADLKFMRNRIRHELVQLLKSMNPQVTSSISKLQKQAKDYAIDLQRDAQICLLAKELPRAGPVVILSHDGPCVPDPIRIAVLKLIWARENWSTTKFGTDHWMNASRAMFVSHSTIDLPGKIRIEGRDRMTVIGPRAAILGR
jgi:tRNA(Ile)-lysidine synthase